jgi:hypothetical protein
LFVAVVSRPTGVAGSGDLGGRGAALVLLVVFALWPKGRRRMRPDRSARHMGRGRDVDTLTASEPEWISWRLGTGAHRPHPDR